MNNLTDDIQAIQDFDPAVSKYLYVEGSGANAHLVTHQLGFLGRIWLWIRIKLGCCTSPMIAVAGYVSQNALQLLSRLQLTDAQRLVEKVNKYDQNHPGTILNHQIQVINQMYHVIGAAKANPIAAWTKYQATQDNEDFRLTIELMINDLNACTVILPQMSNREFTEAVDKGYIDTSWVQIGNGTDAYTFPEGIQIFTTDQMKYVLKFSFRHNPPMMPSLVAYCCDIFAELERYRQNDKGELIEWLMTEVLDSQALYTFLKDGHLAYRAPNILTRQKTAILDFTAAVIDALNQEDPTKLPILKGYDIVQEMCTIPAYAAQKTILDALP